MPGGRRTHYYPRGKPSPLVVVELAAALFVIGWVAFYSWGWPYRVAIASVFLGLAILDSKLRKIYERNGLAVRIPRVAGVEYRTALPGLLWYLRCGFFAVVALMLFFGVVSLPIKVAHVGIICCVTTLFLIGISHLICERHFVNTGRAVDLYDNADDSA